MLRGSFTEGGSHPNSMSISILFVTLSWFLRALVETYNYLSMEFIFISGYDLPEYQFAEAGHGKHKCTVE